MLGALQRGAGWRLNREMEPVLTAAAGGNLRGGPRVRIHLPPAVSLVRTGPAHGGLTIGWASTRRYGERCRTDSVSYGFPTAEPGPKHVVKTGKTPVLEGSQWRKLLQTIPDMTLRDMRDRALIATLTYSFARIGAALNMKVEDLRPRALGGRSDCTKKVASSTPYPAIRRWLRLCARISTLQGLLKTARAGYSAPVAVMTVRCCPRNRWASRMRGG